MFYFFKKTLIFKFNYFFFQCVLAKINLISNVNFIYYRRLSQVKAKPPSKKIKTEATAKPVKCDMKTDKGTEKIPLTTAQR